MPVGKINKSEIIDSNKDFKLQKVYEIPTKFEIISNIDKRGDNISIWSLVWWLTKKSPIIIKIMYYLIKVTNMDSITTKAGAKALLGQVITILALALGMFGINLSPELQGAIVLIGLTIWGFFGFKQAKETKDAN